MAVPAERTLIFQITPWRDRRVSRTVELRADQTLHDLHRIIRVLFYLDFDHLYAFFLNNRAWDRTFEYGGPGVERAPYQAESAPLGELPLRTNKRVLYVFDFGRDLRHEVRVVGEGGTDLKVSYPRVVGSVGDDISQHWDDDDDAEQDRSHEEQPRLDPDLEKLVPGIMEALERYAPRRFASRNRAMRSKAQLQAEADLALALLHHSGGDLRVIHTVEHAVQGYVWGWLCDLSLELSLGGLVEDGLRLGQRVQAIAPESPTLFSLPLLFALAGRSPEAMEHLDRNSVEYPDDPLMLLRAGDAFHALGDFGRAEQAYRDALHWVGDNIRDRREIVTGLERALHALGREDAIAELLESERCEEERRLQEHSLELPTPYRRSGPKVGRNDLCPCGSGKKMKRCCAGRAGAP